MRNPVEAIVVCLRLFLERHTAEHLAGTLKAYLKLLKDALQAALA